MKEKPWTPGEWKPIPVKRVPNGGPMMYWVRYGAVSAGSDNPADVRLMAAAPELVEALESILIAEARWRDICGIDEEDDMPPDEMKQACTEAGQLLAKVYGRQDGEAA